ncbi:MAG: ATPase [Alphaproteobacteria bacterium]|nr:ATPase [Alphaproteobacteria bacterium]
MRLLAPALIAAALFFAPSARAEVAAASPTHFVVHAETEVAASPSEVWRNLTRVDRWWSSEHTYSGDASNLRLDPRAGGCWCERWGNHQSVEHMRVVMVMERDGVRTLRLSGGLGPLQEMGVTGVLTFTVEPLASGAKIIMNYSVLGDASLHLDQVAAPVNSVLMQQFESLRRLSISGTAN